MTSSDSNARQLPAQSPRFATTSWSVVVAARDAESHQAGEALAVLCRAYWYPLYAYIRRQGHSPHEAEDLTQEFFTRLVEKDFLASVDRGRGKFRSFLLSACAHFLANQRDRARAVKRGGRCRIVGLDFAAGEARYGREPSHESTAEKLFARRWSLTLLDHVLVRLRDDYLARGKGDLFDSLRIYLLGEQDAVPYGDAARRLAMSEGSLRVAVHRLRGQFRDLLREEIAMTVDGPEQIEDEIRDLFAALVS